MISTKRINNLDKTKENIKVAKSIKSSAELRELPAYTLIHEEYLDDIKSAGLIFRHKKSGARICVLSNSDENKVFCAGFRTTPENSTGVPHIIEHTVLNGSKNFPSRDPFMQLAKGSLNTFLNAMTYPDKTIYPVASCNDTDFKNLMHVYLDAVFYPNIYRRREIFMQEGWHYELESADSELTINGVVYSEMKGALSNPELVVYEAIQSGLFPDNTYGVNSGGDPDHIPELTYEYFLDFHRRYYHPVNSYIYLYGDMDVEERLEWLDREYLSHFDIISLDSHIEPQKEWGGIREVKTTYSVGSEDDVKGKTFFAYASLCGDVTNVEECIAWDVISDALIYTPGAPIKQALLDAGIGRDITGGFNDQMLQPFFTVVAKDANSEDKERFYEIIEKTLREQVENGINKNSLLSAINSFEFRWREADYGSTPKGLLYIIFSFGSWLYNEDDPFSYLKRNDIFTSLREKINTGYFEDLIKRRLLESKHTLHLIVEPERGLIDRKNEALRAKLASYKASLSPEEIEKIIADTKALREYQSAPPTEEELNCIPSLARTDIAREAPPFYNEERFIGGVPGVFHDVETNGIAYVKLVFDSDGIPASLLPYASFLCNILGNIDTAEHSYLELANDIGINTGGIDFYIGVTRKCNTADEFKLYTTVAFKSLSSKVGYAMKLISEIIETSNFRDTKRLREILGEIISRNQSRFSGSGNYYAAARALSYFSRASLASEMLDGIAAHETLKADLDNFSDKGARISEILAGIAEYIFAKDKLLVSVAADSEGYAALEAAMPEFTSKLLSGKPYGDPEPLPVPQAKNEGFMMPIQVQYVARCGNFMNAGFKYNGALAVLTTALNIDYLYKEIRVKGGAYGQSCNFSAINGNVTFTSYRDPQLRATDEVYRKTGDFIRSLNIDEKELTKLIIGTFSRIDSPKSSRQKAEISLNAYLSGRKYEDVQREREEALDVTLDDLRAQADLVDAVMAQGYVCTIGNEAKLRENADMFGELKTLS